VQWLGELNWAEGRSIKVEYRSAEGAKSRLHTLAIPLEESEMQFCVAVDEFLRFCALASQRGFRSGLSAPSTR
jgi:hypothetical protein